MFERRLEICVTADLGPCFYEDYLGKEYALWLNILMIGLHRLSSFADITVWLYCGRKQYLLADRFDPAKEEDLVITKELLRSIPKKERFTENPKGKICRTVIEHAEMKQNEEPGVSFHTYYFWLTSACCGSGSFSRALKESRKHSDARNYHYMIALNEEEVEAALSADSLAGCYEYTDDDIRDCMNDIYDTLSGICRRFRETQHREREHAGALLS